MNVNRAVKILISSDFLLLSGWGLLAPIFAVFLLENIQGGDIKVAGFAAAVYWIARSVLEPFIGKWLDKNHGEKDDFYSMFIGTLIISIIPIGFIFSKFPWHIYALEFIHALAMSFNLPPWSAIFTRHIDKGREAFEWSLSSTSISLGSGIAGALGGLLASIFGFKIIFVGVSVLTFLSALALLFIRKDLIRKDHLEPVGIRKVI